MATNSHPRFLGTRRGIWRRRHGTRYPDGRYETRLCLKFRGGLERNLLSDELFVYVVLTLTRPLCGELEQGGLLGNHLGFLRRWNTVDPVNCLSVYAPRQILPAEYC